MVTDISAERHTRETETHRQRDRQRTLPHPVHRATKDEKRARAVEDILVYMYGY